MYYRIKWYFKPHFICASIILVDKLVNKNYNKVVLFFIFMYEHNIFNIGIVMKKIYKNCRIASFSHAHRHISYGLPYGLIENGAIVVDNGIITWVGVADDIPDTYANYTDIDLGGRLLSPALIDCHTHLVYGGNRVHEFEMYLNGASYTQVARAGGGIISTVKNTRSADFDTLVADALPRIDALIAEGVGTVEIKSGYGLTIQDELKMLQVAKHLETIRPVRIKKTFLAPHAVPPEYTDNADAYIERVCIPALHQAHKKGLVDAVDAFCENITFSPEQVAKVFVIAKKLELPIKIHAEQLSNLGGAKMATKFGAMSADHLEYIDTDGIQAMARSNTVAVLLPGAFYNLREAQLPPIADFRTHGVDMAIATDCNPGSSPLNSVLLAMNMACTLFRMTPEETLMGVTKNASKALGIADTVGTIDVGKKAEFAVWDVQYPAELSYHIGFNPLYNRILDKEV